MRVLKTGGSSCASRSSCGGRWIPKHGRNKRSSGSRFTGPRGRNTSREKKMGESADCVVLYAQVMLRELGERNALVDEVDDVLCGSAGKKDFSDAGLFEGGDVGFGDDAADEDGDVGHAFVVEEFHELGADGVVRAGENREADDVDVFLDGGGGDHLRGLAQAGVDDLHAGVAKSAGDYFSAAVVAIQAGFGNQHSNFFPWHGLSDGDFFVDAEDVAEGVADFAEGGVGFHGVVEEGHEVVFTLGGGAEGVEAAVDFGLGAIGAEPFQANGLALRHRLVNLKNLQRLFLSHKIVHADNNFFFFIDGYLVTIGGFGDFALRVAALDGGNHAAHGVDAIDVFPCATLDFVGERFDKIRAAERVHRVGDAGFVGDDLLRAQGDGGGELRRQRPGFVQRIGVQRLRAAEHRGESLNRGADYVVVRLLRRQRAAGGLRMKTQRPGARILGLVALDHGFVPNSAGSAILGNFLKEIIVGVKEKGKLRHKLVYVEPAAHSPFDVFHAIAQRKRQFLNGGRAGLADVIAADRNGIEFRCVLDAEFERVDHQPHRRFRWIDVFLLRDVFLQDVVLERAGKFLPIRALLFRDGQIHRPNNRGRRIDGHGGRDIRQRNFIEEHFHVRE